jgi:hypothetical protein
MKSSLVLPTAPSSSQTTQPTKFKPWQRRIYILPATPSNDPSLNKTTHRATHPEGHASGGVGAPPRSKGKKAEGSAEGDSDGRFDEEGFDVVFNSWG